MNPQLALDLVARHGNQCRAAHAANMNREALTYWIREAKRLKLKPTIEQIEDPRFTKIRAQAQEALDAYIRHDRNAFSAARELGLPSTTLRDRVKAAARLELTSSAKPLHGGRDHLFAMRDEPLPKKGEIKRYLLTCAQNNTKTHGRFWQNLIAFKDHHKATLYVSQFSYNLDAFASIDAKPGTHQLQTEAWYDPEIEPYLCNDRVTLAPGLSWCGEVNILPTAVRPLSGFESYTGRNSGIFPHTKMAMQSIASGKHEATKFNYTTGAVTQRNYIQRKAGLRAEFHHTYGALLVEVDHEGNWWCRQINADKSGSFYDLDLKAERGKITTGHRVESITWGDIHVGQTNETVKKLAWGKGGMLDVLRPMYQFFHDVLNMLARSHHDIRNPHQMFKRYVRGEDSVGREISDCRAFLNETKRQFSKSVVVDSNHHRFLMRWLREADYRYDPVNAQLFLKAQAAMYDAIAKKRDREFNLLKWAIDQLGGCPGVKFLNEDESFVICRKAGDGIEQGMHGDRGPNGRRGSAQALATMGRKSNIGHSHTTGIFDGVYQAGTSSAFDMEYNVGPSSWSHSHVVTYANGKRAILTMWAGRWRA